MYYESIQHRTVECANAEEAAMKIRKGNVCSCDALVWRSSVDGQRLAAVGDGGLDSPFAEVAVINLDTGIQIESITFAWTLALVSVDHAFLERQTFSACVTSAAFN